MSTINPQECDSIGTPLRPVSCDNEVPPSSGWTPSSAEPTPPTTQGLPLGGIIVLGNLPSGGSPFGARGFVPTVPGETDPGGGSGTIGPGGGPPCGGGVFVPLDPVNPGGGGVFEPGGPVRPDTGFGPSGTVPDIPSAAWSAATTNVGLNYTYGATFGTGMGNY